MKRIRVKPSKESSLLGVVAGFIMIGIGIAWGIPTFGAFGVIWALFGAAITGYHLLNVTSARGVATQEIDIEESTTSDTKRNDTEGRLEQLGRLRAKGLITEDEYEKKRQEILTGL